MSSNHPVSQAVTLLTAYVSHNLVSREDLPQMLRELTEEIKALSGEGPERPKPPVPIADSYTDDFIICLEDGKKVTLLKRYLSKNFGLTPEEYIEKWGLPEDYPFVTKSYSAKRSQIARDQGLGKT